MSDGRNIEKTGLGETPDDIEYKCLKLCQDYLGGVWLKQTTHTITVKRLTGGMLNQLFYCAISESDGDEDVPQEVAIKFIQTNPFLDESEAEEKSRLLNQMIVTLMVSENGLGPKVYGVFESGVIYKYYKQKPLKEEQQKDERLMREVFEKLARLHAMDVPIEKNKRIAIFRWLDDNYELALDNGFIEDLSEEDIDIFKTNNFHDEYRWLKDVLANTKSPIVFTHNDYRSDNLMVLDDVASDGNRIVIVDYEFAVYCDRGRDFVHICKELHKDNAIFDRQTYHYPPDEDVLNRFFQYYYDQSVRLLGDKYSENPLNSVSHLIKEMKVFWLLDYLAFALPNMRLLDENHNVSDQMINWLGGVRPDKHKLIKMAEHGYEHYLRLKKRFLDEKLFD